MSSGLSSGSFQALARETLTDAVRRGQIAAHDLSSAVLRLAGERSSATDVTKAQDVFLLACRDVTRAVDSMEQQDRPRGWTS